MRASVLRVLLSCVWWTICLQVPGTHTGTAVLLRVLLWRLHEGSLLAGFAEISRKREPNAAGPTIVVHEVATLMHLIETSKPEARAEGIRLIVLLEVP